MKQNSIESGRLHWLHPVIIGGFAVLWGLTVVPGEVPPTPAVATVLLGLLLLGTFGLFVLSDRARAQQNAVIDELRQRLSDQQLATDTAVEELDRFAYVASHDLRAPLRAISQLSQMVVEDTCDLLPEESRGDLELLRNRAQRMDLLLRGLLTYSRCGRNDEEPQDVDLRESICEVMARLENAGQITLRYGSVPRSVFASPGAVKLVMHHLLENTLKHHDAERATVRISFEPDGAVCRLIYQDDGPGIGYRYREKIFEVFHTLKSRDEIQTSGMGMAIARKIMKIQGGDIRLLKSKGRGAAFELTFLQRPDAAAEAALGKHHAV